MPTVAGRILELLKASPGLSDREITGTLYGHTTNQQGVNAVCRALHKRGVVHRKPRPDGRIGNYLADNRESGPQIATTRADHNERVPHPGDSPEQRAAEGALIAGLARRLGVTLAKKRIALPEGGALEIDGVSESPPIICEAWAHLGRAKTAQKHKLLTDAFKLIYAAQFLPKETRKILVVADPKAVRHLDGKGWMAQALRANGVTIEVVDLPSDSVEALRRAQERQFR